MPEKTNQNGATTCGEFLREQRRRLDQITDLGAEGARERAMELLSNIYAVSYQMTFERIEPPGPGRGLATNEPLDVELVSDIAQRLRGQAPELQDIVNDPWKLSQSIFAAKQGNGFALIEIINMARLAHTGMNRENAPRRRETVPAERAAEPMTKDGPI